MNMTANYSSANLLSAVETMSLEELDDFFNKVLTIRAERRAPHLSAQETALLKIVEEGLSTQEKLRLNELQNLRRVEKLDEKGFEELANLTDCLEEIHAKRMNAILEISEIRGITFDEAIKQIGLKLPDYD